MKIRSFALLSIFFTVAVKAQSFKTGKELLKVMHQKYYQAPCKCYTFSQHNTHYKADTISGRSVWHEAIEFPDKFRIHFGDKEKGNSVLFRNDSLYRYEAHSLVKSRIDSNSLLLLLGGMYYRDFDDVIARLQKSGYLLDIVCTHPWKGGSVFIIGATENDFRKNQIWIDQITFKVLRIIEINGNSELIDMCFDSHQKSCSGFVENKVSFKRNGNLEQVEKYFDIKEAAKFPD